MLVLSRRKNERIVIGGGIVVTVVAVQGSRVRLGVEAPPEVPVHREEILGKVKVHTPPAPVSPAGVLALPT